MKTFRDMAIGAVLTFAAMFAASAVAVVGTPPDQGFRMIDGQWAQGVAQGANFSYAAGITAHAGGGQTSCQNIPAGIYLVQIDTVASTNDSVCMPFAVAGTNLSIRNNGAQQLGIWAQPNNNVITAALDQINNTSNTSAAYTLTAQNIVECFVAKNGSWSCARGN
jgi:hypothetical protein